uniref:Glycosyltransferase 61 catalytic domain-containing protein n=1 Tax=Quercus lobata TaxID=97700 RepID=A0A7N2LCI3_QUELO
MKSLESKSISKPEAKDISCDRSHKNYDFCTISGPTVLDPTSSTFFVMDPKTLTPQKPTVEKVRPYPRKWETHTMSRIKEVTLISSPIIPNSEIQHKAPAILLSAGGLTENIFHDFNDGFIPLFITANSIFPDQDVVLVISKARDWPILVLISRNGGVGRVLLNQNEVKFEAEKIGFNVIIFEPTPMTPMHKAYELIHSGHAMIGIDGAALTHTIFLRPSSVFMQVVPLGTEWAAEYRIEAEESSLLEKYSKDDVVIRDPVAFRGTDWSLMNVYLKEQNVTLDLVRFREYLKEMYKKAKKFMNKEG